MGESPTEKLSTRAQLKLMFPALPGMFQLAFKDLVKNDPLRMAGATAFFTSFALPPILIILIQALGLVISKRKISRKLFQGLEGIIEKESMNQVVNTLRAFRHLADNWFITIGGSLFLLFVATTLFKVVKDSINQLWRIRVRKRRSFGKTMLGRLKSFLLIIIAGLLFVAGVLLAGLQAFLGKQLPEASPLLTFYFNSGLNYMVSVVIVTLWFAILFRYLPDGRPAWKVALPGAMLTSLLFNTGKFVLHRLLMNGNVQDFYGSSGAVVILLLFVFYSALILYFGVSFTKVWADWLKRPIRPVHNATRYKISELHEQDELRKTADKTGQQLFCIE